MDGKSETTTYVSKAFEVTHNDVGVNDRLTQYKHYIYAGDEVVAIQIRTLKDGAKTPDETRYLHKDALGNVDTITDSHGAVIQRISYDPFGNRSVTSSADPDRKAWTSRGFTGHEHLDGLGLIHMNARLYDPEVGRFLSPDSYIQAPEMSQSYNRYIYVMNNPLKYTDPSGHFFDALFDLIGNVLWFVFEHLDIAVMVAAQAMFGIPIGLPSIAIRGAAAGFISTLVHTNSFSAALRNGIWGGAGAAVAGFVGHGGAFGFEWGASPFGGGLGPWLAHGISQGVITQLRGGQFKSGFVGGIIGKASDAALGEMGGNGPAAVAARTVTAAVFGGLAAEATGGSFADGALAAAMVHLFNDENLFGDDDPHNMFARADKQWVKNKDDEVFDLYAHGTPKGITDELGNFMSVKEVADLIRNSPDYHSNMAINLWACNTGAGVDSFAQQLAVEMNAVVIAPNQFVMYPVSGVDNMHLASKYYAWSFMRNVPIPIIGYVPNPPLYKDGGDWLVFF